MRILIAALAVLTLSGCWTGGPFFQATDAVPALPAGDYLASYTPLLSEPQDEAPGRIEVRAEGMTTFTGADAVPAGEPVLVMGFTPLEGVDGHFLAWIVRWDNRDLSGDRSAYGVLNRGADGVYRLRLPGCTDPMEAQAQAAGASVSRNGDGLAICTFRDRASLVAALRAFVAAPPPDVLTLNFRPRG